MKTKKVVKLTQNIYTTHSHTDILSIITVLKNLSFSPRYRNEGIHS